MLVILGKNGIYYLKKWIILGIKILLGIKNEMKELKIEIKFKNYVFVIVFVSGF